ncbi:hypothetical protein PA598K_02162 [Paenibacillus sp. 598K]|uniref:hypothetical protein n=1 Tax=Paenibacillus sp. 598K TaxID=1117987 RepID=UPI000FFA2494|nr:hypothetical protein [Paenibacillus sp. 598K]GBF73839.1 hypothetical protein PA598K_02162 [Paenibacillus sp. 598K]
MGERRGRRLWHTSRPCRWARRGQSSFELTYKTGNVASKRLYAGLGFVEKGNTHPSGVCAELVL